MTNTGVYVPSRGAKDISRSCPACGAWSTDYERRGGKYRQGPAPALCIDCQERNPGGRWCARCRRIEFTKDCNRAASARGRAEGPGRGATDARKPCPACGRMSTDFERRGGEYRQGPAPALCIECQRAHPGERWCKRCSRFEASRNCPVRLRARDDALRDAGKYRSRAESTCKDCGARGPASVLRPTSGGPVGRCEACEDVFLGGEVTCPACGLTMSRRSYFGPKAKKFRGAHLRACFDCTAAHSGELWCVGHKRFEPVSGFSGWSKRTCREGAVKSRHQADIDALMLVHGTIEGQCMCCFRPMKTTNTDHDHGCCPGRRSCGRCVRGLICGDCNAIEGKIRTIYGPPYPRLMQEYLDRYAARWCAPITTT